MRGSVCLADEGINLEKAAVVAEVYSRATKPSDEGFVACYFIAHDLDPEDAMKAMNFFVAQPSLIVDVNRLVADAGAEFPALVTIRYTDETRDLLATVHEYGALRELPDDEVVSREGWSLFWACEALARGEAVPEAAPLLPYDYRDLRRKIYALRAGTYDDRDPWMVEERDRLRNLIAGGPEGGEKFAAQLEDLEAALSGRIEVGETYSVVIPTSVERQRMEGAISVWVPQAGHEIVVAHGLDAIQAARVFRMVSEAPEEYVAKVQLLSGRRGRETLGRPMVVRDTALNWISTDFTGRRSGQGFEKLREGLNAGKVQEGSVAVPSRANVR